MGFAPHARTPAELSAVLTAERAGTAFLAYRDGLGDLRLYTLDEAPVVIGRARTNNVVLDWDRQVSRTHAQLESIGDDWVVLDGGLSRNGCAVNAQPLKGRRRLVDGDVLKVGATALVFCSARATEDEVTAAGSMAMLAQLTAAERRVLVALCRPVLADGVSPPASNREIGEQLFISGPSVKTHMRALFIKLDVQELPQNRKRATLARRAIDSGLVAARDVDAD